MRAWGRKFAKSLRSEDVVALVGELGAGKTTLVQSIAEAWGYRDGAASPTFALANEYPTKKGMIFHMDMYRLSPAEAAAFPLEDYWGTGLCLIEWADRIERRLPPGTKTLHLKITAPTTRTITVKSSRKSRGK